jgi:DNA repair protein RecN (Recombination protein N)
MLVQLAIRDIVLIDRLDLGLGPGLNVLTGETGAGKSILLDALGLALGRRADAGLVRQGVAQGVVAATFEPEEGHPVQSLLDEQGLDGSDHLVLRRIVQADGKSRAFVNDQPVSVALLRRIGDLLIEINGQNDEQGLLDAATHRALLDVYGGLAREVEAVRRAHAARQAAAAAAAEARAELEKARAEEEYAAHVVAELGKLNPEPGEEARLAAERLTLQAGEKIAQGLADAVAALEEQGGVESRLRSALRTIERVAERAAGKLDAARDALDRALVEAGEAGAALDRAQRELDADPSRLERIEERLFALRAAGRKHHCTPDDLAALRDRYAARLAAVAAGDAALKKLDDAAAAAAASYAQAALKLSQGRAKAAARLDKAVATELAPLKLGQARFVTTLDRLADAEGGAEGIDRVVFTIATNPGTAPGPLAKIASGGELSRLMLALKVALAGQGEAGTLIFDEVDRGVGGATAAAVGERLARLAEAVQVLVVTHSPQVAALGAHHWRIAKSSPSRKETVTRVEPLDRPGRIEEIARMLSGAEVTAAARAAAESLMA